ncbi:transposase [Kitasatospora sp. NPDC001540]|uniref:transposase n=1 Tax=Kitasatospora sp. NPDC001540 TaxID=3364014 RepID=UPI0036BEF266
MARPAAWAVRPEVWAVDGTGFPKNGKISPGVARQYSGTPGTAPLVSGRRHGTADGVRSWAARMRQRSSGSWGSQPGGTSPKPRCSSSRPRCPRWPPRYGSSSSSSSPPSRTWARPTLIRSRRLTSPRSRPTRTARTTSTRPRRTSGTPCGLTSAETTSAGSSERPFTTASTGTWGRCTRRTARASSSWGRG